MDLGTGDGRAVLARAAAELCSIVLGIDAAEGAMAEASRRAARRGPTNALFLATGAEQLALSPLAGRADLVTVTFPWGSLLRGALGLDDAAMDGIASVLAPGGRIILLTSVVPADGVAGVSRLDRSWEARIRAAWARVDVALVSMCEASEEDVATSGSSWARRLRSGDRDRQTWRIELRRQA